MIYIKLIQIWRRRWWEIWFLGLECLSDLCHGTQNSVPRVKKAFLQI